MSDGAALLRAILDDPADDTPRLVYADWLGENGDEARAEFIRVQVELEHLPPGPEEHLKASRLLARYHKGAPVRMRARTPATLLVREALLMNDARLLDRLLPPCLTVGPGKGWRLELGGQIELAQGGRLGLRRGFVESVTLPADAWLEHGPALCALHPVTDVRLAGKEPGNDREGLCPESGGGFWDWFPPRPSNTPVSGWPRSVERASLPEPLWRLVATWPDGEGDPGHYACRGFATREGALACLSAVCLAYAREKAGLPPLPPSELKSGRA